MTGLGLGTLFLAGLVLLYKRKTPVAVEDSKSAHDILTTIQANWDPETETTASLLQDAVDAAARGDDGGTLKALLRMWHESGRREGDRLSGFSPGLLSVTIELFQRQGDYVGLANWCEEVLPAVDHLRLRLSVQGDHARANHLTQFAMFIRAGCGDVFLLGSDILPQDLPRAERFLRPLAGEVKEIMEEVRVNGMSYVANWPGNSVRWLRDYCEIMADLEVELHNYQEVLRFIRYHFLLSDKHDEEDCQNILLVSRSLLILTREKLESETRDSDFFSNSQIRPAFSNIEGILRTLPAEELYNGNAREAKTAITLCLAAARPLIEKMPQGEAQDNLLVQFALQLVEMHRRDGKLDKALQDLAYLETKAMQADDGVLLSQVQTMIGDLRKLQAATDPSSKE